MGVEVQSVAVDPWSAAAIEHNRQWLGAYLLALSGDAEGSADMVQEVFAIALRKRGGFQAGTNFGGWLRVIARNVALQHCRKRGRELLLDRADVLARLDRAAETAAERSAAPGFAEERAGLLRECLGKLSERVRRMVELRYGQSRSPGEVAAEAGLTVAAANMALCRARFTLAECIRRKSDRSFRQGVTE
jgi:RNA polymerase sigma factor (sigma-70 family)